MEIKVLGSCCSGCKILHETVNQAVADLGIEAVVEKVEDMATIMSYNVMQLPGLVIDGKVMSAGRKLSLVEVTELLRNLSKVVDEPSCPCGANYFCKCE